MTREKKKKTAEGYVIEKIINDNMKTSINVSYIWSVKCIFLFSVLRCNWFAILFIRFFLIVIQTNRFDGISVGLWSTYRPRTGPFTPRH